MTTSKTVLSKIIRFFGLDLRSLALMRISIGVLIISDIAVRSTDLLAHYTDEGVLPRAYIFDNWDSHYHLSLHLLSGDLYFQVFLFLFAALVGFFLIIGFHTRSMTFLSWIMMVSIQNRNPLVLQGGDVVFRLILFWAIFLPWGEYFSVDSLKRGVKNKISKHTISAWTIGYALQLLMIYYFSSILKSGYEWHQGATAVYYTLSLDQFTTPLGRFLLRYPDIMSFLTRGTWYFEAWGPFVYFIPIKSWIFRTLLVFGFIGMHASFAATMHLGHFSYVMIAAWLGLLPTEFIDLTEKGLRKFFAIPKVKFSLMNQLRMNAGNAFRVWGKKLHSVRDISKEPRILEDIWDALSPARLMLYNFAGVFFIITVFMWNGRSVGWEIMIPRNIDNMARYLRIDQYWNMFAPYPLKDDGWYVVIGEFRDGSRVDLFQEKNEVSWEKPEYVAITYKNQRWRKLMMNLWSRNYSRYREPYLDYLCDDATISGKSSLDRISMYFVLERTLPNYKKSEEKPILLEQINCTIQP